MPNPKSRLLARVAAVLVLVLASATLLRAQQTFYVPILQASGEQDLGIALSNRSLSEATVTLIAHDYSGGTISGPGIANPATFNVPGSGQRAFRAAEIFGSGIVGRSGWIEIRSAGGALSGCFVLFNAQLTVMDGADLQADAASRLVFPKVAAATQIAFINTGPSASATVSFYRNSGQLAAQRAIDLTPHSGFSGPIESLLPAAAGAEGYVVLEKNASLFSSEGTLFGFETYLNKTDIALLNAIPATALLRIGYFPQIATQGEYTSRLSLVNTSATPQTVTLTASGLEVNGASRSPASAVAQRTIPSMGRIEESMTELFGFSGGDLISGFLKWETQGDGAGLIGVLDLGTGNGTLLAAAPAQGAGMSDLFFPQLAEGEGYYTGLALLNTESVPVLISVEAFAPDGSSRDRAAFILGPGQRRSRLMSQILPNLGTQLGGYVRVSANRPVFALEVVGATKLTFLSNILPQGVSIPTQPSGSVVTVSSGATLVAQNSVSQIVIPPGALSADTAIDIAELSLPSPPNQRIVAAVDAQPSGIVFRIPARLSFGLTALVDPGTEIPVLLFDSSTSVFSDSGFKAVVDESGRNATAFVTHFTLFALAVDADRFISVTSISPNSGNSGTEVTLAGTGFHPDPGGNSVTFAGSGNTAVAGSVLTATPTRLTVRVPNEAVSGYVIVRAAGKTSQGILFTVAATRPAPSLTGITPESAVFGSGTVNLRLTGANFDPSSAVRVGGTAVSSTFADTTLIFAAFPATQFPPGTHPVTVFTPPSGGGESQAKALTVAFPVPSITSLSTEGGLITYFTDVRIRGVSFFPGTRGLLDGAPIESTFVDATTLDVRLTSGNVGSRSISVVNPTPGGGSSNAMSFAFAATVTLTVISGSNQSAFHGTALGDPLVVRVTDPFGNTIAGAPVLFEVVSGGGSVVPTGAVNSDANGLARATAKLGDTLGVQEFRAVSAGFSATPVSFVATSRTITLQTFISGLSSPVFLTGAGDGSGRRFIVEQTGRIRVVQPGAPSSTVFLDIVSRVVSGGEQGLLGLAFHPQFSTNRRFFVNYTRAGDAATVIAEYRASSNPNVADTTETVLLTIAQPFSNHNGGMVAIGPDGFLYIGMGDGGAGNDPGNRAQNDDDLLGKMLRIDIDHPASGTVLYSSPSTNPFFGSIPGRDEIFATGLRNPWRFSFDRLTGKLYVGDVGQGVREEIDIVENGGNYGWRVIEGTLCTNLGPASCATPGFIAPIAEYDHGGGRCSVTGGYVYRGSQGALPAGAYIYGDYCTGEMFMLNDGVATVILSTGLNISSFGEDEAGELFVVHLGGSIHRIVAP